MPFANTQMMGMDFAFPDVCLTPTPVGPIPIPYPNIAMGPTAIPTQFKVFTTFMPNHNLGATIPISNGDNAGLAMGVASGLVMGPSRNILGSFKVFTSVLPAAKFIMPTIQNSTNMVGVTLVPSQVKVIILL